MRRLRALRTKREIGNAGVCRRVSPFYKLVRRAGRLVDGEVSNLDAGAEGGNDGVNGDAAAMEVLEILSPLKIVNLLIAMTFRLGGWVCKETQ